jgi:hypothetical protein
VARIRALKAQQTDNPIEDSDDDNAPVQNGRKSRSSSIVSNKSGRSAKASGSSGPETFVSPVFSTEEKGVKSFWCVRCCKPTDNMKSVWHNANQCNSGLAEEDSHNNSSSELRNHKNRKAAKGKTPFRKDVGPVHLGKPTTYEEIKERRQARVDAANKKNHDKQSANNRGRRAAVSDSGSGESSGSDNEDGAYPEDYSSPRVSKILSRSHESKHPNTTLKHSSVRKTNFVDVLSPTYQKTLASASSHIGQNPQNLATHRAAAKSSKTQSTEPEHDYNSCIIDTGCTPKHLIGPDLASCFTATGEVFKISMDMASGTITSKCISGTLNLLTRDTTGRKVKLSLYEVCLTEDMDTNLISVRALFDQGHKIAFHEDHAML